MNPNGIVWSVAIWLIPLIIAIVFHEVSHGLAARALGDRTAERLNRLSLNPLRHVDPIGTVVLPLMLAIAKAPVFGWARPVPVDTRHLRDPRRAMMLVALAGPAPGRGGPRPKRSRENTRKNQSNGSRPKLGKGERKHCPGQVSEAAAARRVAARRG